MIKIKSDKIIVGESLFSGYVYVKNSKIVQVSKINEECETYDFTGKYVSAGFIDMHTHGAGGYAFINSSVDDVISASNYHLAYGMTSIVPTVSAAPISVMESALKNISEAKKSGKAKNNILGAHLEGPYLSSAQAGAQCPDFIEPPQEKDYLPLLERYSDVIARWSYAPENDAKEAFAKALQAHGVVSSAGHTDAIYDDLLRASRYGCNLITHLYSCTSTVTREMGFRRLGVIETAFLLDEMFVEIICDGRHLPPELIRLIYKIKGADRIALVTDSLALAGTDQKHGFMQSTEYIIEDGVCKLMDRSAFAGSIATADRLVRVAVQEAGIPICDAVKMMTKTPAAIMGLPNKGVLVPGADADIVVFDGDIRISRVLAGGELAYRG